MAPKTIRYRGVLYRQAWVEEFDVAWNTHSRFEAVLIGFAKELAARLGEVPRPPSLGHGEYGEVYALGKRRVLKLTTDQYEAKASNTPALRTGQFPHLVRVFDVFAFPRLPGNAQVWGIVTERLKPPPSTERRRFTNLSDTLRDLVGETWYKADAAQLLQRLTKQARTEEYSAHEAVQTWRQVQFGEMLAELRQARIQFIDFHGGNLMKRGDTYVLIDLGRSASAGVAPAQLTRVR